MILYESTTVSHNKKYMHKNSRLILVVAFISIGVLSPTSLIANMNTFFKSFNSRYYNTNYGIEVADSIVKYDSILSFTSKAYNYFYQSNYDSANLYINKVIYSKNKDLYYYLNLTCKGFIEQRFGFINEAFTTFDSARNYYATFDDDDFLNNELLLHGAIINEVGIGTVSFYYLVNENIEVEKLIQYTEILESNFSKETSNELLFHTYYFLYQNLSKPELSNQKSYYNKFKETSLEKCLYYSDSVDYYTVGNLFELFGIYYDSIFYSNEAINKIDSILGSNPRTKSIKMITMDIINDTVNCKKLGFLKLALKFFKKYGDPFQIAGANHNIAKYFYEKIIINKKRTNNVNTNFQDSIYIYASKALCYYIDKSQSTNSKENYNFLAHSFNDSSFAKAQKVLSYEYLLKTLKVLQLYYGIRNETSAFIDVTRNIEILSNKIKQNSDKIYYSMIKANKDKKYISEDLYKVKLITIIAISGIVLIVLLYYLWNNRKKKIDKERIEAKSRYERLIELEYVKHRMESWNKIVNKTTSLKEKIYTDEKFSIRTELKTINEKVCKFFDAEFAAIGIIENLEGEKFINDLVWYYKGNLSEESRVALSSIMRIPYHSSIIGEFLSKNTEKVEYKSNTINLIENKYLKAYRKILKINRINLFSINKIKNETISIGYIYIFNSTCSASELEKILNLSKIIANIFEILETKKITSQRNQDEKFVSDIKNDPNKSIGSLIQKTFIHFNKVFNAPIISFRVPIINGKHDDNSRDIILVLNDKFIDKTKIPLYSELERYYDHEKKQLRLNKDYIFSDQSTYDFPNEIIIDKLGQDRTFYKKFGLDSLFKKTTYNLLVPIKKDYYKNSKKPNDYQKTYWTTLIGLFNLQIIDYPSPNTLNRLSFLSEQISLVINSIITEKKYTQITTLGTGLNELQDINYSENINQITNLLSKALNAEVCSIFIHNKSNDNLELYATNTVNARYNGKNINLLDPSVDIARVHYGLENQDSVTVNSYLYSNIYIVYDRSQLSSYSDKYLEIIEGYDINDYVYLIVPIKDKNNRSIGVIRYIGLKSTNHSLIHTFWDFDLETVEFISSLAYTLIENAMLDMDKDNFVKHLIHETKSPIFEMLARTEAHINSIKRSKYQNKLCSEYSELIFNSLELQSGIIRNVEDSLENINLHFNEEFVNPILIRAVRLLEMTAHAENQLSIRTNVSHLSEKLLIDKYGIEQVFINLLRNAINYSHPGTTIEVYYKTNWYNLDNNMPKLYHEFEFVNIGIGIDRTEKEMIFKQYKRGSNSSETKPSGMGIGLYLSRKIMRKHKGDCFVKETNNPTIISIILPKKTKAT